MHARTWGPFTGGQLTTIIVASILVVGVPGTAWAIDTFSNVAIEDPVSGVKATVDSGHALLTAAKPKPPPSPFLLGGERFSNTTPSAFAVGPTSSPINVTSVSAAMRGTATDTLESNLQLVGVAVSGTATDCSSPISTTTLWESGKLTASANAEATFPTPLQFRAPSGDKACLQIGVPTEAGNFSAVGNVSGYLGS